MRSPRSRPAVPTHELVAALDALVIDYQALNPAHVVEYKRTPSASTFAAHVNASKPFVLRRQHAKEQLVRALGWSKASLTRKLGDTLVDVAVTPDGRADSVSADEQHFIEPATWRTTMASFLRRLEQSRGEADSPAFYLQSQNGNLSDESSPLHPLLDDIGTPPAFASEYFADQQPITNLWIGDSRSVTSAHKDPFDNLYLVLRGSKTFTLLPPHEVCCCHEQMYDHAQWRWDEMTGAFELEPTEPRTRLPWLPVDLSAIDTAAEEQLRRFSRLKQARPLTVTVNAGDVLFLPALWIHQVAQSGDMVIAVNWWVEMQWSGVQWPLLEMVRRLTSLAEGREDDAPEQESGVPSTS